MYLIYMEDKTMKIKCRRFRKLMVPYLDGELEGAAERQALSSHLEKCEGCKKAYADLKDASRMASSLQPVGNKEVRMPEGINDTVRAFVYQQAMIPEPLIPAFVPRIAVGLVCLILAVTMAFQAAWEPMELQLSMTQGEVGIMDRDTYEWRVVNAVSPHIGSAELRTSDVRRGLSPKYLYAAKEDTFMTAQLGGYGRLAVAGDAVFWPRELVRNRLTGAIRVRMAMREGIMLVNKHKAPFGSEVLIQTPRLTAVARGTKYAVSAFGDDNATVTVLEGKVEVSVLEPRRMALAVAEGYKIDLEAFAERRPRPVEVTEEEVTMLAGLFGASLDSRLKHSGMTDEEFPSPLPSPQRGEGVMGTPGDELKDRDIEEEYRYDD